MTGSGLMRYADLHKYVAIGAVNRLFENCQWRRPNRVHASIWEGATELYYL